MATDESFTIELSQDELDTLLHCLERRYQDYLEKRDQARDLLTRATGRGDQEVAAKMQEVVAVWEVSMAAMLAVLPRFPGWVTRSWTYRFGADFGLPTVAV